jgi:hypothetical protein
MIPRRTVREIPLGSLQPAGRLMTVEVKRNKFLVASAASAVVATLSLLFFPGETVFADGRCIRYIDVPFLASFIEVPYWYKQAFASAYFGLLLLTIVFLFLAWTYRKGKRPRLRLGRGRKLLRAAAPLWADHVVHLTGANDNPSGHA